MSVLISDLSPELLALVETRARESTWKKRGSHSTVDSILDWETTPEGFAFWHAIDSGAADSIESAREYSTLHQDEYEENPGELDDQIIK